MRYVTVGLVSIVALASGLTALGDQGVQPQTFPRPTPAASTLHVEGEVSVVNTPAVRAQQEGPWLVTLEPGARVSVNPLGFLQAGGSYVVTWPDGVAQTVVIVQLGEGGWALGQTEGRREWINFALARTIRSAG
jgi:hypothetical protein